MQTRPRLLVLASTAPRPAGWKPTPAFVRDLAAYEATTYDTTVLVPAVPGAAATEQVGALTVIRFRFFPRRWEDLAEGAILENVRSRPTRLLQVHPFSLPKCWPSERLFERLAPTSCTSTGSSPKGFTALIAATGIPMLVTTLGGDLYGLHDPISRWITGVVIRRARALTTMNHDMRRQAHPTRCRPEPNPRVAAGGRRGGRRAITMLRAKGVTGGSFSWAASSKRRDLPFSSRRFV